MIDGNVHEIIRPKTIKDQFPTGVMDIIDDYIKTETLPHSFLFEGQQGAGKTTSARTLSSFIFTRSTEDNIDLEDNVSYIELNAAKFNGVDYMRRLLDEISNIPIDGENIVLILDEAHALTAQSQSALLKVLEETQSHLYIILCTTDMTKLRTDIRDRCKIMHFTMPSPAKLITYCREYAIPNIIDLLDSKTTVLCKENIENLTDDTLSEIISKLPEISFRTLINSVHDYIISGKINIVNEEDEQNIKKVIDTLVNPQVNTWRQEISKFIQSNVKKSPQDIATIKDHICNQINTSLTYNLTNKDILPKEKLVNIVNIIHILKEPLIMGSHTKADLNERLIRCVLTTTGILK